MYLSATADTMKAAWRRLRKPVLKPRCVPPLARYYSHFPPSKNYPWSYSTFFLLLCFKFLISLAFSCWFRHHRRICVCVWSSRPGIHSPPSSSVGSVLISWGNKKIRMNSNFLVFVFVFEVPVQVSPSPLPLLRRLRHDQLGRDRGEESFGGGKYSRRSSLSSALLRNWDPQSTWEQTRRSAAQRRKGRMWSSERGGKGEYTSCLSQKLLLISGWKS